MHTIISAPPTVPRLHVAVTDDQSTGTLESLPTFGSAHEGWSALARASSNIFSTPEWVACWWRRFGGDRTLQLTAWRGPEGRMVAILPLYTSGLGPLRLARLVGSPLGSRVEPICAPGDRAASAHGLRAALAATRADLFVAEALPGEADWTGHVPGAVLARVPSPLLDLAEFASWDDYLASRSSNLRQELRRKERKLQRERGLAFRLVDDRTRLGDELDRFFSLHSDRWSEGESSLASSETIDFLSEFATTAFDHGWLRLWFLDLDGAPAAAWLGFRYEGVETYYQAGRSMDADGSVGLILLAHTIREALADGIREYRLGPGGSPYKYRFTDSDPGIETVAVAGTRRGRLALQARGLVLRSAFLRRSLSRAVGR